MGSDIITRETMLAELQALLTTPERPAGDDWFSLEEIDPDMSRSKRKALIYKLDKLREQGEVEACVIKHRRYYRKVVKNG